MTKDVALQSFFEGFGLSAYPATSVPEDVVFPYLTYELVLGAWGDGEQSITANLWYYTESEADPTAKAQEISDRIGYGGVLLPCDGGSLWIKRGSPWCQALGDETIPDIKRRMLNIAVEFHTIN